MRQCAGTKRDGSNCTATVEPPQTYCWWHDPAHAEARRRAASRGGRGKANREVATLKAELKGLIADVRAGELNRNNAAVMIQAYRALLEYIKVERGVYLEDDLAVRIEELQRGQRPHAS